MHAKLYITAVLLVAALSVGVGAPVTARHPNVLVIITDQQSADAMSCRIGTQYMRTPNMDSLAARGVTFTQAYSANPICVPARTAMLTGRYPHETGVQNNKRYLVDPKKFPTFGSAFRQAGYSTGYVGKWHVRIPIADAAMSGFDYTGNLKENGADAGTPAAVAEFFRREKDSNRPFLLVASFVNPHNICEWARGDKLPDGDIGSPPAPEECPPAPTNLSAPTDEPEATQFARKSYQVSSQFPVGEFDAAKWRQYRWAYYRMIEKVDAQIGSVLRSLRDSGRADDTLIVLTSDHGDCQGAHGWNQKTVFYDESSRVPFIICPPGSTQPSVSKRLVQTGIDLFPTLCDFAGIPGPSQLPGMSQRPTVQDATGADTRGFVVVSNHLAQGEPVEGVTMDPAGRMLRTSRYKYCVYDQGRNRESLTDMEKDAGEMVNLARDPSYQRVLNEHRRILLTWGKATGDTFSAFVSPE